MAANRAMTKKIPMPIELTESDGEAAFAYYLRILGPDLPPATREYSIPEGNRFSDVRKKKAEEKPFRADFAWPEYRVLFEVQGIGHNAHVKYREDIIRHDLLTMWGYKVLYATPDQIEDDPARLIAMLRPLLTKKD